MVIWLFKGYMAFWAIWVFFGFLGLWVFRVAGVGPVIHGFLGFSGIFKLSILSKGGYTER